LVREIFSRHPEVKLKKWDGEFWLNRNFVNTVNKFGDEQRIAKYLSDQGLEKEYMMLHKEKQLWLKGYPAACDGVVHFDH